MLTWNNEPLKRAAQIYTSNTHVLQHQEPKNECVQETPQRAPQILRILWLVVKIVGAFIGATVVFFASGIGAPIIMVACVIGGIVFGGLQYAKELYLWIDKKLK